MDIKNKNLGFLMTRGISLHTWDKIGSLHREIKPYIELSKNFKEIYVFTYGTKSDLKYKDLFPANVTIICRPACIPKTAYMFLLPIIHASIFRNINILKTNQMDGSWAGVIAKKIFTLHLVTRSGYEWLNYLNTTNASFYKKAIAQMVERWSYKNADKILITSKEDKDFIIDNFKVESAKVEVIRNYIDTEKFKPDNAISKESNRIIFVGRFHKDKNISMLVESLQGIECNLVLVGEGSEEKKVRDLANQLNVTIEMLGKISQEKLPIELQKSELCILPSQSEGNPKVLLEAMACGLACIGTNVKGIREVIDDGENGLLTELAPSSLREKIKSLLENKGLRDKLGTNAREKITREYSLISILTKELEIYKNL